MTSLVCTAVLILFMLTSCYSSSSIGAMHSRLRTFNTKLNIFQIELAEKDIIFHESIDIATESLRQELTHHFQQQIQEAMDECRGDESVPIEGSAHDEIRRLKQGQQTMKRQLHNVMKTLRQVQQEKDLFREAFLKAERLIAESWSKCGQPSETPSLSKTTTSINTSPITTSMEVQHRLNRLLIGSPRSSQLRQFNLHSGSWTEYSIRVSGRVSALCFVQRLQKLLVGTHYPDRITSNTLDADDTQTLREGVSVLGIAVDEGRELVFMSTERPENTISRMSTRGKNFMVIRALTAEYKYQRGIAVNTREREVYAFRIDRVFSVSYDGKVLRTLVSGARILSGVVVDSVRDTLYFNAGYTLKKMTAGVVSDVIRLGVEPGSLTYYNNTVYYGGWYTPYVRAVRLGEKSVDTRLRTLTSTYNSDMVLCLVQ